jgi:hypothetical protein
MAGMLPRRTLCLSLAVLVVACAPLHRTPEVRLSDPGFERARLAEAPVSGWYSDAARDGRLRVAPDSSMVQEGAQSIRFEPIAGEPSGPGRPSVSQVVDLGPAAGGRYQFSVALRASEDGAALLEVYVWDGDVARALASREVRVGTAWSTSTLDFDLPADRRLAGLFVYLPTDPSVVTWLDDAGLTCVE